MNVDQTRLNAEYQEILNEVYGGEISLRDKYLNPNAVILHHCKKCMKNFWDKPLWLVNKRQSHDCFTASTKGSEEKHTKTPIEKAKKVTKGMKLEMVQLYQEGFRISDIRRKLDLAHKTVDYHLKKAGVK